MTAHFEIEQKSVEWFEIKHGKIGGTKAKELLTNSDTLLYKILAQKIEAFDEDADEGYSSDAMERGNELEPEALLELSRYAGVEFVSCGWIQSDHNLLGISPDGITADLTVQAEVKCPQAVNHLKYVLADEIPSEYVNQCVHAFTVNPLLEKLYFCSYRPENELVPLFVKTIDRESIVNNGTEKTPVMKKVQDLVDLSLMRADLMETRIEVIINQLKNKI